GRLSAVTAPGASLTAVLLTNSVPVAGSARAQARNYMATFSNGCFRPYVLPPAQHAGLLTGSAEAASQRVGRTFQIGDLHKVPHIRIKLQDVQEELKQKAPLCGA